MSPSLRRRCRSARAPDDYGVALRPDGTVDEPATERLRAEKRSPVWMFHRDGYFGPLVVDSRP